MISKIDAGVAQYFMRQAFEEGYRAANGGDGRSKINPDKGQWFDHWVTSQTRAVLVANGLIDKDVTFR